LKTVPELPQPIFERLFLDVDFRSTVTDGSAWSFPTAVTGSPWGGPRHSSVGIRPHRPISLRRPEGAADSGDRLARYDRVPCNSLSLVVESERATYICSAGRVPLLDSLRRPAVSLLPAGDWLAPLDAVALWASALEAPSPVNRGSARYWPS